MCELFGLCSNTPTDITRPLKEFFSHSEQHNHGWGMAFADDESVSVEKEPVAANRSHYLRERMREGIVTTNMIAHIRLASVGRMFYNNTHPFVGKDNRGRRWTLAHNGTIFDGTLTDPFADSQRGQSDSERVLLYILDAVNRRQELLRRSLLPTERFELMEQLITALSAGNKLNLLVRDGEFLYVHCNYANTLHYCQLPSGGLLFSTHPLRCLPADTWQPLPMLRLMVYSGGNLLHSGAPLSSEYFDPKDNSEQKELDYANL